MGSRGSHKIKGKIIPHEPFNRLTLSEHSFNDTEFMMITKICDSVKRQ